MRDADSLHPSGGWAVFASRKGNHMQMRPRSPQQRQRGKKLIIALAFAVFYLYLLLVWSSGGRNFLLALSWLTTVTLWLWLAFARRDASFRATRPWALGLINAIAISLLWGLVGDGGPGLLGSLSYGCQFLAIVKWRRLARTPYEECRIRRGWQVGGWVFHLALFILLAVGKWQGWIAAFIGPYVWPLLGVGCIGCLLLVAILLAALFKRRA